MQIRRKLKGIAQLIRLDLSLAAAICVVAGEILALSGIPSLKQSLAGFSCGFFISASALVLNDFFDVESDRVNAPNRPLPSGIVSKQEIIYLTALTTLLGLYSALVLGISVFSIGIVFWIIGVLYNWKLKRTGLLGNIMVASSVAITFIIGGFAVGNPWNITVWSFGLMAFLVDLGEEISADAMDLEGDKLQNSKSIAIVWGKKFALKISSVLFGLVILVSFFPLIFGKMGSVYLLAMIIIDSNIIYFVYKLLKSKNDAEGRKNIIGIYRGIMVGIIVLILGLIL
ncbi:MAG: Digeranylgeranylglyceryl phosphate synthase [Candidatus Methanofastidiosum methylothiophilum]|uniref:Digeranylgeranylglyceryl phosphate synthase n=1 Tax=Candidatus Methanofastidiosum methylothiophilum TaxID=1705564 RepID=A0A150III5_9EURY|nr:MAG: Digeranylgeranylglyceryl phosphate synthase [Candidatus Methanofastidiosum methylthiophilus]KYC47441.1 MAG: Digeranylgeranylglyceryl phosphate synthase [Candidatus Methanofastidiosum methylthiophilus]KYC50000.1 MAG: Digeranylgeranylglyceryl phosphate synthase [Candidatus Methanofastidiosum methylthiophilus]